MPNGSERLKLAEKILSNTTPAWEAVRPYIVEPTPQELEAAEAEALEAHTRKKRAQSEESSSNYRASVTAVSALIGTLSAIQFEPPPLFAPLPPILKNSETPFIIAGVSGFALGLACFAQRYAKQMPGLGEKAQLAFKMAGFIGVGASFFVSTQNSLSKIA